MIRLIGLDYGSVTTGVAVSDPLLLTAQGLETIRRTHETKLRKTLQRIEAIITEYSVTGIVLGYPLNLDGSVGARAEKSAEFAETLKRRTGLPVILWDERFTTVSAHRYLDEAGLDHEDKAKVVDTVAAGIILQSYLDYLGNNPGEKEQFEKHE